MTAGQSEIRMIWLMTLIIVGVSSWYLDVHIVSYLCGLGFVISIMQYIGVIEPSVQRISAGQQSIVRTHSKVPLYLSSLLAVVGGLLGLHWLMGFGMTAWVFFLLRWLQHLEYAVTQLESAMHRADLVVLPSDQEQPKSLEHSELGLVQQIQAWLFQGNPVLKAAIGILVIGLVLLLRFATEHWQLSLSLKLAIVAAVGAAITAFGAFLIQKNRSFALALEGLGLAVLFLTLFFAYYNAVLGSLWVAAGLFVVIQAITLSLSLKQQSVEIAIMAMLVAYIAPFTLPVREASAVEFIAYYLVINIAVAILSTLRPWKYLNQIAFLMSAIVGGGYAFLHGNQTEKWSMTALVLAHSAVFIWLGFRFSQLVAKADLSQFKLKPVLDVALIFAVPVTAYGFLYLIHFQSTTWQALFSLGYAAVFMLCWFAIKKTQSQIAIAHCYFSLMLIFLLLIPPILLPEEWSVVGWAVEGVLIYVFALVQQSSLSRYLASALLVVAGLSSVYYAFELNSVPKVMYWILAVCYWAVIIAANWLHGFRAQLSNATVAFFAALSLIATGILFTLIEDALSAPYQHEYSLFILAIGCCVLNEIMLRRTTAWSWLIAKWAALAPLNIIALCLLIDKFAAGAIVWDSAWAQWSFVASNLLLSVVWLRPVLGVREEKEWVSLGTLLSLALASSCLLPSMPYFSVVLLPLVFCFWCYQRHQPDWQMFWQAKTTLLLMAAWIICSQLFSQQSFTAYLLPVLNPFDVISIAMLTGFIWMLQQQVQAGRDRGVVAILMLLSLLWLSSYIVLRGLHYYLATPLNRLALWQDATVQLSLTLLWVILAWATMWWASQKALKPIWILGASILVLVSLKLVLFDLSHIGTWTRVLSFLCAGGVMLLIAYLAPMPEAEVQDLPKA